MQMNNPAVRSIRFVVLLTLGVALAGTTPTQADGPYDRQVAQNVAKLGAESPKDRAGAAEALGFLRAYSAERALIDRLADDSSEVRRQAAMSLGWCGGRAAVGPLLDELADDDWITRQAAHVSLTNLTGMEFPFRSTDPIGKRTEQAKAWRDWWAAVPSDRPPAELFDMLVGPDNAALGRPVTALSTYRGPTGILTDGQVGPAYWQTKQVPFPQWVTVDLQEPVEVDQVVIRQWGASMVMTDYELAVSLDNEKFDVIKRAEGPTPISLAVDFSARKARYVRITSFGSANPKYPCTFFEIEVNRPSKVGRVSNDPPEWRRERALRALGALSGKTDKAATEAILKCLGPAPAGSPSLRPSGRAGIRSLGRLRDEAGFQRLLELLDNPIWARSAAEALGDRGDRRAVGPLLAAYSRYAKMLASRNPEDVEKTTMMKEGRDPANVPADDKMGFPSQDRMLETPYTIAYALCRLPLDDPKDRAELRKLGPRVLCNMPGDHDTFMLYQAEVGHLLTRHLLEQAGLRQEAAEHTFALLGQPRRVARPPDDLSWPVFKPYLMAHWLPTLCTDKNDLPRLLALLEHKEGFVRLNAAKALGWLGDRRAIGPLAKILTTAKAEADYGYDGRFKFEEYADPAPRWREGFVRALGQLGPHEHTDLIVRILNDERSVLEIRHAAAEALGELGGEKALAALGRAALEHSFHSVRHVARDALRYRGVRPPIRRGADSPPEKQAAPSPIASPGKMEAIVFIKGSNTIPNVANTVQQCDNWRQTYVVTDSGPAYRPGRNLYMLRPPVPGGKVTPLTGFPDGYVAEPEMSWDGGHVIFTHRGQDDDPWWHVCRINVDGSGLVQLTKGPYHDVGPAYLPDGRIVFGSSRGGIRDEYHGYPCTALYVMNADGGDMHPIATNIGRDNEPAVLPDGRIVFSRLEVFYSRNKTELTVHAMHPDGTQDVVLYGPERRDYWQQQYAKGPRGPGETGNAPRTHRVLRISQPQAMPDGRHVIVATPGGLTLLGSRRDTETIITPDNNIRAYTTPFPLPDGRVLCASTLKAVNKQKGDLGLYLFDPVGGKLELIYNDPATADFEPRPVLARQPPIVQPAKAKRHGYSGRFLCSSVFVTQEADVPQRGRLVRLIEGVPVVGRHSTQTNDWPVWKNHGGTFARVLGTVPLAPDGSFNVEVPADRLMHFQVLDSDRRVIGNQLTWIYPRPGERKSCVGCHEKPHTSTRGNDPLASHYPPVKFLPNGDEFSYRAKAWMKGYLPAAVEERTRTVRSVNLLGRQ